jgi:aspartate carbamoyltransferase catalytic subunit
MGVEAIVIRHWASGSAATVASSEWSSSRVVNAGDGTHEHPTQALLDALTMRNTLGDSTNGKDLTGAKVLIVGDILHSRVARSNLHLLTTLGAEVSVCGPSTFVPRDVPVNSGRIYWDFDEALAQKPDFVMMLRMQQERMTSSFIPNPVEYSKFYGLTQQRFSRMPKSTFVMHPGPMNRGLEIASEVADSERSLITNQVANGVAIRMAVLYRLLAQEGK